MKLNSILNQKIADSSLDQHIDFETLFVGLNNHAIVAVTDTKGKIVYANDKFCEISGYTVSELLGKDHRILNSGYHKKEFFKILWNTISSGNQWQGEIKNRAKNGDTYWVDTTIVPMFNSYGDIKSYISIRTDITKYKLMEERSRLTQINLQTQNLIQKKELTFQKEKTQSSIIEKEMLVNSLDFEEKISRVVNFITDKSLYISQTREIIKVVLDQITEKFSWDVGQALIINEVNDVQNLKLMSAKSSVVDEDLKNLMQLMELNSEKTNSILSDILVKNEKEIQVVSFADYSKNFSVSIYNINQLPFKSVLFVPIFFKDKINYILQFFSVWEQEKNEKFFNFIKSISFQVAMILEREKYLEQLKFEEQKKIETAKFSALGQMIGGMAHEINNPLTYVSLKLKLLLSSITDNSINLKTLPQDIQKIIDITKRIEIIIRTLLNFSYNTDGAPKINYKIQDIIEETLVFCREKFKKYNVELIIQEIPESVEILCHPVQISQVLLNLLNNAFDAVENAEVKKIEISFSQDNEYYILSIQDTGPGIPESLRKQIFEPFFTTKSLGKGTGLGLSLSKTFLYNHNGSLELSKVSDQTCFHVKIPKDNLKSNEDSLTAKQNQENKGSVG